MTKQESLTNSTNPNSESPANQPLKRGWALSKCSRCPNQVPMEKKYAPHFAPLCSETCVQVAFQKNNNLTQ